MIVRVKQTIECRDQRHANAGGRSKWLRPYNRAGLVIPEEWSAPIEVTDAQHETLRADPHIEIEDLTAATAAETETRT